MKERTKKLALSWAALSIILCVLIYVAVGFVASLAVLDVSMFNLKEWGGTGRAVMGVIWVFILFCGIRGFINEVDK